jgi:hypothetical protein
MLAIELGISTADTRLGIWLLPDEPKSENGSESTPNNPGTYTPIFAPPLTYSLQDPVGKIIKPPKN